MLGIVLCQAREIASSVRSQMPGKLTDQTEGKIDS
jgi:hypothetical protein